ncbi:unnamed protein product [Mytilus edulis]|uniref:Endonuclease/exonuclease/phosphatase domain-containing protein n=1 Tax=Mytilus edulis TaxID=6550 RepID=A0A8S3TNC8_MYTED|nr:unnamed protein product [Mytilus edulis]
MASNQEPEQPKKKKKRIRSKNKDEPIPGAFDLSAILNSQQTFPLSNNMNGQPYMNNNTNFHNMSMPMMSSPFVTSPTQQFQMGAPYMPCPTPTQASPPQWATELLSKFEAMSVKMNSIDEIKSAVSSVDFKLSEMKGDMNKLSKRVLDVETSQNFISKSFDENIKMHEKTNKKIESDIKKLATECEALRNDMSFIKRDSKNLSDSKVNLQKIFKANEKLNNDLESIKCESMRDNLLFHGIKESEGEDCALIIKSMCENNLEIEDELNIKSAFRLECWINNTCNIEIDDFVCKSIPLSRKKYKQGCGMYVMIRKILSPYVKIIDISYETLIWIRIAKELTGCESDYLIANLYIPPQNSSFYRIHNCDLFYELESQMIHYSAECPNIFVIGDLNARTANMNDYVQNDKLHDSILDRVGDLFTYVADEALSCRNNPDAGTNDYGTKLLNLCKSSGLRIINGRHPDGLSNDFTYSGPRGMSVIDYLLAKPNNIEKVLKFITSNFTTYSDHAPIHVQFKTKCTMQCNDINSNLMDGEESQFFKWNKEFRDLCYNALLVNADDLSSTIANMDIASQDGMDLCINNFTQCLTNVTAPFFQTNAKSKSEIKAKFPKSESKY